MELHLTRGYACTHSIVINFTDSFIYKVRTGKYPKEYLDKCMQLEILYHILYLLFILVKFTYKVHVRTGKSQRFYFLNEYSWKDILHHG